MRANFFALKEACCRGFFDILLLDAKEAVDGIKRKEDWAIRPIILAIRILSSFFNLVDFFHVPRNVVEAAHVLSKQCKSFCWDTFFLDWVRSLLTPS